MKIINLRDWSKPIKEGQKIDYSEAFILQKTSLIGFSLTTGEISHPIYEIIGKTRFTNQNNY